MAAGRAAVAAAGQKLATAELAERERTAPAAREADMPSRERELAEQRRVLAGPVPHAEGAAAAGAGCTAAPSPQAQPAAGRRATLRLAAGVGRRIAARRASTPPRTAFDTYRRSAAQASGAACDTLFGTSKPVLEDSL